MPPNKKILPHRGGYKLETRFPKTGALLLKPLHGAGPRCRVDYDPHNDGGPWTTVHIMRIDDGEVEEYACAMPRYYAVPLILINKRLAFFEAHCGPDGRPLPRTTDGAARLRQRDLKEYTYLWRMRSRFLQDIYDMNHDRQLSETWQSEKIHGYVHRTYNRYGHDAYQRLAYWKAEIEAGRMPYTTPDIADMDWGSFVAAEMTASTRLNAFLWNRISQGYDRVVQDAPPSASWQAWRRGGTSRDLSASLYRTPPPPPPPPPPSAPFPAPGCLSEEPSNCAEEQGQKGPTVVTSNFVAAAPSGVIIYVDDDGGLAGNTLDASLEWVPQSPMSDLSRGAGQAAASTGSTMDHTTRRRVSFSFEMPRDMALTDLLLTVSHTEDGGNYPQTTFRVDYPSYLP